MESTKNILKEFVDGCKEGKESGDDKTTEGVLLGHNNGIRKRTRGRMADAEGKKKQGHRTKRKSRKLRQAEEE